MKTQPSSSPIRHHIPSRRMASAAAFSLGLTFVLTSTALVSAQTWETVDDVDAPSATVNAVASDSDGNVFASGWMKDETTRQHAVIMKSSDGGATWSTSADFPSVNDASAPTGSAASFSALAVGNVGGERHIVAAGRIRRIPFSTPGFLPWTGPWLIIRSRDAGATWETLDESAHPTYSQVGGYTFPRGVAVDGSGNIYVAGSAQSLTSSGNPLHHWIIRKGTVISGGMTWSTVGDFPYPSTNSGPDVMNFRISVYCAGGSVYAAAGGGGSWIVRKSSNGGASWQVIDTYRLHSSDSSQACSISADNAGNLYVAGTGRRVYQGVSRPSWIVRRGTNSGTKWSTVDQFQPTNGGAEARGVTVDPAGDVHVTGTAWTGTSSATPHWVTRNRAAANGAWATTDDFGFAPSGSAGGRAVAADPFGNLFATGSATDAAGVPHGWLVRRKLAP